MFHKNKEIIISQKKSMNLIIKYILDKLKNSLKLI
jgi:hypothetical protein